MGPQTNKTSSEAPLVPLAASGEMGKRIHAYDWSQTAIGPIDDWPQSLKTAVRILLNSRYPMFIWWGPELINIYNDAYIPVLGARHPQALGQSAPKIWADVWPVVGPQSEIVLNQGQATWNDSVLLMMERYGRSEETYFTFSYSPIPRDSGDIGGLFCVCTEDTRRIFSERQLALLRDLATRTTDVRTWQEACTRAMEALSTNLHDLPFALLYIAGPDGTSLSLAGSSGIDSGHLAAPPVVTLAKPALWPLAAAFGGHELLVVEEPGSKIGSPLPAGAWQEPPSRAALIPIAATGLAGRGGVLVVGLNPFRLFDDDYRNFLLLVAGQISASIASAQAYQEEKRRAEALAELDRAKTTFFSNVSHEFRTPLTLILGPVEELLQKSDGGLRPVIKEQLEVVHRNSLRLLKLVNSILDFSRLEAGRLQASYEPIDLAQYTAELATVFRAAIEHAGLQLIVNCLPLPELVYVDKEMWEKIVLNLLSNALKFTLAGEIEVRLEAIDNQAQLTVRDTGVGIPVAEMPRLFERFHRVKEARGRSHEGTGIGLALVQELVRLHGGAVRAESILNEGSRFIVTVPLGKAHLDPQRIKATPGPTPPNRNVTEAFQQETVRWLPDARRNEEYTWTQDDANLNGRPLTGSQGQTKETLPRILWADDNADMREYVSRLLSERFDVEAVADGQAALEAARADPPDLVISDIMMPRLDGFSLLHALRADPALRETPIILLSARAGEEARIEGLEANADDYLIKPFSARELLARVDSQLRMARVRREGTEALRQSEVRHRQLSVRLKALLETTSHLIETLETSELLSSLLDLSREVVAADALGVWRKDDQGDWSLVAGSGLSDDFIHESLSRTLNIEPPVEPVVVQPEVLADRSTPLLRYRWERYEREGIRSLMILPLSIHGQISGTLVFYRRSTHPFTEVEIESAQALANIASSAITTAELYESQSHLHRNLREGERRLRLALTAARAGSWELDIASGRTIWSQELISLYGYDTASPHTYNQWLASLHPDDREQVAENFRQRLDSEETEFRQEFRIIHPQLGQRWIFDVGYIERDQNGRAIRCTGINLDITGRKQAEEALRQHAEEIQTLLDTLPIGVFFAQDPAARLITGNRAAYELMRLPPGSNLSKSAPAGERPAHFRVFQNGVELPADQLPVQRAARGEQIRNEEVTHLFEDGTHLNFLISAAPLYDSQGRSRGAIASLLDITERKQTEAAIRQLNETLERRVEQRTQQVRDLARRLTMAEQEERRRISQILHDDLQQLVYAVKMKVDILHEDLQAAGREELLPDAEEVRSWIDQVVKMTRQLTVDLSPPILENEGLANAIEWLQSQMKELHGIEVTVASEHDWVIHDEDLRVLLFQIVRELLFNVKKHAGVDRASVILKEEAGHLVIIVMDQGQGFAVEEVEARQEQSAGFGLFSARERLRLLGGRLKVLSHPGEGTHIEVHTPVPARGAAVKQTALEEKR